MKHKHAEVIKAWADGATIEYRKHPKDTEWRFHPLEYPFYQAYEYRVKPVYPTLGEIAKAAWHSTLNNSANNGLHAASGDERWKTAAAAVKAAIESEEHS